MSLIALMNDAGELGNLRAWLGAFEWFWIRPAVLRKMQPTYLRHYSPTFHPWQHDTRALVEEAKRRWLRSA